MSFKLKYLLPILALVLWSCGKTDTPGGDPVTPVDPPVEPVDPVDSVDPVDPPEPPEDANSIRVLTYNLLATSGRRTEMTLDKCRDAFGKIIRSADADIMCFNELDATFASELPSIVGESRYKWDISNPNKVENGSLVYYYSNGFAYDASKFTLVSRGMNWYISTGTYTSSMTDAKNYHMPKYRTLVWCCLKHKHTQETLYVVSTHLPLSDDGDFPPYYIGLAHRVCATALGELARSVSAPCILAGDFNSSSEEDDENSSGHSIILERWTDAYDVLKDSGELGSYYLTYNGTLSGSSKKYYYESSVFTKNHPERRIDHIMYKNGAVTKLVPKSYSTITTGYVYAGKTFCPSDHLPVIVEFEISK